MPTADLVTPSLHASALQDGSNGEQENTNSDSKPRAPGTRIYAYLFKFSFSRKQSGKL